MATVSIEEYEKAITALEKAIQLTKSSEHLEDQFLLNRDGSIQRFEFCVELAWKVSAKVLGTMPSSPKVVLREMLQNKLIEDFDLWFDFITARNKTSHTYDQKMAGEVYQVATEFLFHGQKLLTDLKKL